MLEPDAGQPGAWLSKALWLKMKSPDNKFEIQKTDYNEIRVGSPLFGQLEIIGSPFDLKERYELES